MNAFVSEMKSNVIQYRIFLFNDDHNMEFTSHSIEKSYFCFNNKRYNHSLIDDYDGHNKKNAYENKRFYSKILDLHAQQTIRIYASLFIITFRQLWLCFCFVYELQWNHRIFYFKKTRPETVVVVDIFLVPIDWFGKWSGACPFSFSLF